MADTSRVRASISWYGAAFSMAAIAIQFIVPALLLTGTRGENINTYFRPTMVILAILCSTLIFLSSYHIQEKETSQDQEKEPFFEGLKKTLKNKNFRYFEFSNFCNTMLTWLLLTGIFYYLDYVVTIDLSYFIIHWWYIPLIALFIFGIAKTVRYELDNMQEKGPRFFLIIALITLAIGFGLLFLLGRTFHYAIWAFLLIGLGYIMASITISTLMGDVMDYDEIVTGTRREGSYAGLNAIITKPAISIANWAFLGLIEAFGFLRPDTSGDVVINYEQPKRAITGILFSLALLPAIFSVIAIYGMWRYKLHGKDWKNQKLELEQIHVKKEREYMMNLFKKESLDFDPDLFDDLGE